MAVKRILCIDIGGSHIKGSVLDAKGKMLEPYKKLVTPAKANPANVMKVITELAALFTKYDNISAGFPGYIKKGVVITAPNLGTKAWVGFDLEAQLQKALKKPARVVNDADMQGIGIAAGKGLEIVVTLGTGFGTALIYDGKLLPHLELAHHPITKKGDYDVYIGDKAYDAVGKERWNKRMEKVIGILKTVFNYDHLYIGGGNAANISFKLDKNISIVTNKDGIKGGAMLWK